MRGISTVVDVTVFLLLVSAAVGTLTLIPDSHPERVTVDTRANLLASVTADIEYRLGGSKRRAHGTVAALLARAAVANASIDGRRLSSGSVRFRERVQTLTLSTLGPPNRTQVLVRWVPYRGSPVRGTLRVGSAPPPGRDVTVATLTVPAPGSPPAERTVSGSAREGFGAVAAVAARETATTLVPERRATLPSSRSSPAIETASSRFRTLADATGVSVEGPLAQGNASLARRRVVAGLTDRFATDMRTRFESPTAAARALRTGSVRLTLRRWET